MAVRGNKQRGRDPFYDPAWGKPYRTTVTFAPDEALKVIQAAKCAGASITGLIAQLVQRMPVDGDGCPEWVKAEQKEVSDPLPLASG